MVNFKKKLAGKKIKKPIDPIELYETLDRAHDKGPLRPAQISVLSEWFKTGQKKRDSIIKLHTGQGKTLVGLLLLQSRLNDNKGPALYLCPDNFLIAQTCDQAKQFGIETCMADPEIPDDFIDLVITSPPYNIDLGKNRYNQNPYDLYQDNKDHKDYIAWLKDIFESLKPKMKSGGRICINIGDGKNGSVPTHSDIIQFMTKDTNLKYL